MAHSFAELPESIQIEGTNLTAFKIIPDTFQPPEYIVNLQSEGKTPAETKQNCMTQAKSIEAFLKQFFNKNKINIMFSYYIQTLQQQTKDHYNNMNPINTHNINNLNTNINNTNNSNIINNNPNTNLINHNLINTENWVVMIDAYFKIIMPHEEHIHQKQSREHVQEINNKIQIEDLYEKNIIKPHHYKRGLKKILQRRL
ncbi:MAG: hypothetical protein K0B02_03895 [DPANN group archaeon]|nr:hypothetical protein [DPANN group archaeon]